MTPDTVVNAWMLPGLAKVKAREGKLPDFARPIITVPRKPTAGTP
jgi:hypothetical protein